MLVYTDIFSHEEIISDSYEMKWVFDNVGVEIESKYITKGEENIDIGCGNAFGGGGDDEGDAEVEKVLDLIDAFRYQSTSFTKGQFTSYVKGYMKKVKEYLAEKKPERVTPFMTGAKDMVKFILERFDDFEFYTPESYDTDNCIIMAYWKEEALTPTFIYFMDGLKEEKMWFSLLIYI